MTLSTQAWIGIGGLAALIAFLAWPKKAKSAPSGYKPPAGKTPPKGVIVKPTTTSSTNKNSADYQEGYKVGSIGGGIDRNGSADWQSGYIDGWNEKGINLSVLAAPSDNFDISDVIDTKKADDENAKAAQLIITGMEDFGRGQKDGRDRADHSIAIVEKNMPDAPNEMGADYKKGWISGYKNRITSYCNGLACATIDESGYIEYPALFADVSGNKLPRILPEPFTVLGTRVGLWKNVYNF